MELFLDTTGNYLNIAMYTHGTLVENIHEEAPRAQSEKLLPYIDTLCKKHNFTADDIEAVIITRGPGSYTGVRIAMTFAKVFCAMKQVPLYTVSTLQAMSLGTNKKVCALIDAKSKRAFVGFYQDGKALVEETILTLEEVKEQLNNEYVIVGDAHLVEQEATCFDMNEEVFKHRECWEPVSNIHTLTPTYLKDSSAYGK